MADLELEFKIDELTGAIEIILLIAIGIALLGIRFLGSGLSDQSVRILTISAIYSGIWIMLSLLATPLLLSIEIFGLLMYIGLSIGYILGVIEKLSGSE